MHGSKSMAEAPLVHVGGPGSRELDRSQRTFEACLWVTYSASHILKAQNVPLGTFELKPES